MREATTKKMVVRTEADLRKPLTKKMLAEIAALKAMPDSEINTIDIPELPPGWRKTARPFHEIFKPRKEAISLRIDADILAWLKAGGDGWQTRINGILRERMQKR